jgi:hypothetical protein
VLAAYAELAYDSRLPLIEAVINEIITDSGGRLTLGYSLAIRGEQKWDLVGILDNAVEPTERGMAALALARFSGQNALLSLQNALSDASHPVERATILAALVNAGAIESSQKLHEALCEWPDETEFFPPHQISYKVRREFIWALSAGGLPSAYPRAWADELAIPLEQADDEFSRLIRAEGRQVRRPTSNKVSPSPDPTTIFLSYSRKDVRWKNELLQMLTPLNGVRELFWVDTDVIPGERWDEAIKSALDRATIAVLLVTKNFFSSQYIATVELPKLIERVRKGTLKIGWISCGHALHGSAELGAFQALNDPSKPLDSFRVKSQRDHELVLICERIRAMLGR